MKMTPEEKDFLLADFKSAWDTVIGIDNRRTAFASYFAIIFVGSFSVFAAVIKYGLDHETKVGLTFLLLGALTSGIMIIGILISERSANVRYRKKANAIRDLMIGHTEHPRIRTEYLQRKDLDVPLADHKISKTGNTLKWISAIVLFQLVVLCGAIYWLWWVAKELTGTKY